VYGSRSRDGDPPQLFSPSEFSSQTALSLHSGGPLGRTGRAFPSSGTTCLLLVLSAVFSRALGAQDIPLAGDPVAPGVVSGHADPVPYSTSNHFASSREMPDALHKFSAYLAPILGFDPRLAELELYRHYVGDGSPLLPKYKQRGIRVPGWSGHCNGSAAAACLEREPPAFLTRSVDGRGFTFTGDELKALLAEAHYSVDVRFRGRRSFIDASAYRKAGRLLSGAGSLAEWRHWHHVALGSDPPPGYAIPDFQRVARDHQARFEDIHPFDFHRVLRTVIERARMPFAADRSTGPAILNHAAYAFTSDVADAGSVPPDGNRLFRVETRLNWAGRSPTVYTYELQADAAGALVSGKWTGDSVTEHPDFVWTPLGPMFFLNDLMAEAVAKNVVLSFEPGELAGAVSGGSAPGLQKLRSVVFEVAAQVAPVEAISAQAFGDYLFEQTRGLVGEWNAHPSRPNLEAFLTTGLSRSIARDTRFGVDLYRHLSDLLPPGHRAVPDPLNRLLAAAQHRAGRRIVREAGGMLTFTGAFLLKEVVGAVAAWDAERARQAVEQLGTTDFWSTLVVFSAASHAADRLVTSLRGGGQARASLPLAAGMAVTQILHRNFSARDLVLSTASFVAAGSLVHLVAERALLVSPAGWPVRVASLAATLWLGEEIHGWLSGFFIRSAVDRSGGGHGKGVQAALAALKED